MEMPEMPAKYYDPRAAFKGTALHTPYRQTRGDEAVAAAIGQQIIFYTWMAGFTATCLAITYAIIKRILK